MAIRETYFTHSRCTNFRCDLYMNWFPRDKLRCDRCNSKLRHSPHSNYCRAIRERKGLIKYID